MNPLFVDDIGRLVLRLTLGVLILFHGVAKVLNLNSLAFIGGKLAELGLPNGIAYLVFVGEIVAPLMIILGVYARIGGLLVMINMLFALALVHSTQLLTLSKNGGWALELQGFYLLTGLALFFLGSGRIALKPD